MIVLLSIYMVLSDVDLSFEFRLTRDWCDTNHRFGDVDCNDRVDLRDFACIQNDWEYIVASDWIVPTERFYETFWRNMGGPVRCQRLGKAKRLRDEYTLQASVP